MMDNQSSNSIMRLLAMGNLLQPYATFQAELRFINEFKLNLKSEISDKEAIEALMKELDIKDKEALINWQKTVLLSKDIKSLSEYAQFKFKRRNIIEQLISSNAEALFLRFKDRLDRVLYSFLRVTDQNLAYHLYYSIESGEITFGDASEKYSEGPESKTQGILGPCDLTVPHPDISSRLRTATPKQLFKPFAIDQWFVILRLEYRFDSELNQSTKQVLGKMLLTSKIRQLSQDINNEMINNFLIE